MFSVTENGPIDNHFVKAFIDERLQCFLSEYIWTEIDLAFGVKWNQYIGYGGGFFWDEIIDFVYGPIASKRILISYGQVLEIVDIMLTYIERDGGFLDGDRC